jgi:hypothetical protein
MVRSKATVLKVARLLDIQEHHLPISLNMAVCLNNKVLSQPDRWLPNNHQPLMEDNKAAMVDSHSNPRLDTEDNLWVTEDLLLLAQVVMVVANLAQTLSGVSLPLKPLATVSKATKVRSYTSMKCNHEFAVRASSYCTIV